MSQDTYHSIETEQNGANSAPKKGRKKSKAGLWIVIAVLLLGAIAAAVLLIPGKKGRGGRNGGSSSEETA